MARGRCALTRLPAVFRRRTEAGSTLEAGKYKVTANLYVAKSDNFIKLINAYLGDESVPIGAKL